jgi:FMNH2-dependent dimethyl sulfone monooxygenase
MRAATNPIFGENRMKLGVFASNGVGHLISNLPPHQVNWPAMLRIAKLADDAGFEALVPYARWKGLPRPADVPFVPHDVFEPFTWAAGLAQATTYSAVFATIHVPLMHPIVVAKMATTIDHISGGRFGINIVAGWNGPEFKMFGTTLKDHDERYAQAAEWTEVLRRLWTEREFDFDGTFYRIDRGESHPKPIQTPYPAIMSAGGSNTGRSFAATYADMCFVQISDDDATAREQIAAYRDEARNVDGREVSMWTGGTVVLRDTQSEAEARQKYLEDNKNDAVAAEFQKRREDGSKALKLASGAAVAGRPGEFVGDAQRIAEHVQRLSDLGIDGMVIQSIEYEDMLGRFIREVLPLLERAGLRRPHPGKRAAYL